MSIKLAVMTFDEHIQGITQVILAKVNLDKTFPKTESNTITTYVSYGFEPQTSLYFYYS